MEINKGIEPFDDVTDLTRNNPDRKPFGRSGNDNLSLSDEYATPKSAPVEAPPPAAKKVKHKLSTGIELEADTIEEMATLIKKEVAKQQTSPAPLEFEDKPAYQPLKLERKEMTPQQKAEILNLWTGTATTPADPQAAMRKLQEAEVGVTMEELLRLLNDSQTVIRLKIEEEAGADFMGECDNYRATKENAKKLVDYIKSKNKPITTHNLIVAFRQLSASDPAMLRQPDAELPDPNLHETPEPPVVVPSNQGMPTEEQKADTAKVIREFSNMTLKQQQEYFANLRRRS